MFKVRHSLKDVCQGNALRARIRIDGHFMGRVPFVSRANHSAVTVTKLANEKTP